MNPNWYVLYTKTNCEKKVINQLVKKKVEYFFPKQIENIGFETKKSKPESALFKSLIFINVNGIGVSQLLKLDHVLSILHWKAQPAIIPIEEITAIRNFVQEHKQVTAVPSIVKENGQIEIFTEKVHLQTTLQQQKKTFLSLPTMGYLLVTTLQAQQINTIYAGQQESAIRY